MGEWKPTPDEIRKVALKIAEAKGWKMGAPLDGAYMPLVDETIVMTVRALEMCGYRIADKWAPIASAPTEHLADMLLWDPIEQIALPARRFNDRIGCEIRLVARYDDKKTVGRCTHWHPPLPPPPKD